MDTKLQGMTVLITGASGGIGGALAEAFAAEGCNLLLHAHGRIDAVRELARERAFGERAHFFAADVRDEDALDRGVGEGVRRYGRVDVCVPNAGIWPPEPMALHEQAVERLREVIEVDLLGALVTARAFLHALAEHGPRADGRGASICFVGSTAGRFGEAGHVEYAASKAGLRGVVRSLKNEIAVLDPHGRVNMVEPGWTVTPMAGRALSEPGVIERVVATMALRQLARPEDIARAVVTLASPALARHITGEILTVAGGMEGRRLWADDDIDPARVRARLVPD
jgi:3-oxoacyl-[acyl-carrier protein] reductase